MVPKHHESDGRDAVSIIAAGEVALVINTPQGSGASARLDGWEGLVADDVSIAFDVPEGLSVAAELPAEVPLYVPRDRHEDIVGLLRPGTFLLVQGDSGAGKSRVAFEALHNAGGMDLPIVIVLNDNGMSIAPNVGAMSKYLTRIRSNPLYNRVREEVKGLVHRLPEPMEYLAVKLDDSLKNMGVPGMVFEDLGFQPGVGPELDDRERPAGHSFFIQIGRVDADRAARWDGRVVADVRRGHLPTGG